MEQTTNETKPDGAASAVERRVGHHGCCADRACNDETCMELPTGKTCGDCVHCYRCTVMFGHTAMDTYCDWFPRRFREKVPNARVKAAAEGSPATERSEP